MGAGGGGTDGFKVQEVVRLMALYFELPGSFSS